MEKNARKALITYALVSEELEKTNDFFLGLIPLFTIVAASCAGQNFEATKFSEEIKQLFGLEIHPEVGRYLIPRLVSAGLLSRVHSTEDYVWRAPSTVRQTTSVETDIDLVIDTFSDFLSFNSPLFKASLQKTEIENLLLDAILFHDVSIRSAEEAIEGKIAEKQYTNKGKQRHSHEFDYYFFQFIQSLRKAKDPLIDKISGIANAVIVSEAVLDLNSPSPNQRPRRVDLTVYLDGPFVMDFIGLSGPDRQSYSKFIIDSMRSLGCQAVVFRHYVQEIKVNLRALFNRQSHQRRGPTADALINRSVSEEFAKSVMHNPEHFITEAGLTIFDISTYSPPTNSRLIFGQDQVQELTQQLISRYEHLDALDRDIMAAQFIVNRRQGHSSDDLFQARSILLTNNQFLAEIVNRFISKSFQQPRSRFGPLVHQQKLYAILWLVIGGKDRREMSRLQLIRNCARAVQYSPEIIQRIRDKLEAMDHDKAAQFEVLISQPRYVQISFDLARADPNLIDEKKAEEILEALKSDLITEEVRKNKELVSREREKRKTAQSQMKIAATESEALKEHLKGQIQVTRRLIEIESQRLRRKYALAWLAFRIVVFIVGASSAVFALYAERFSTNWYVQVCSSLLALMVAAGTLGASVTGFGMEKMRELLQGEFQKALDDKIVLDLRIPDVAGALAVDFVSGEITWPPHLISNDLLDQDFRVLT